jgi:signal transduction histidine kinase
MQAQIRILMLEDMEEDAGLVDRVLHKAAIPFIRTRVDTEDSFIEALDHFKPDIILSDHSLPQFNSVEALKICAQKKIDIPFILVTGAVSEEFAVSCLQMGAVDYVLKTNLARLPQSVLHALEKHQAEKDRLIQAETLRKQNEELVKINKELDSLVYRMSHDLRSPLSSILGLTGLSKIEGHLSEENAKNYFELIEANVLRLDSTLSEIMDYYRNAKMVLKTEEIALEKLIYKSLDTLKYMKGFDSIEMQIQIQQDAPMYSDEYRWSIIIRNLLSNSIKYTDDQKEKSFVSIVASVNQQDAVLCIEDNGIGIQAEYLSNIFDMFYRATEKSYGAGLGLYIVKEMVAKLDGEIQVNAFSGQGTVVTVTIPNGNDQGLLR